MDLWTQGPMPRRAHGQDAHPWMWDQKPAGHIGLLLQHTAQRGCAIEPGWKLHTKGEPPIDILDDPLDFLRDCLIQANADAAPLAKAMLVTLLTQRGATLDIRAQPCPPH